VCARERERERERKSVCGISFLAKSTMTFVGHKMGQDLSAHPSLNVSGHNPIKQILVLHLFAMQ